MFLIDNYQYKNTPVHNLNPLIKFVIFILVIFLLFLKINILSHVSLILFAALAVYHSDNVNLILRKAAPIYLVLLLFLFTVNFFFMKTPGFWILGNSYRDLSSLFSTSSGSSSTDVEHGWYVGGKILMKSDGVKVEVQDTIKCIETSAKLITGDGKCTDSGHGHDSAQGANDSSNWKIIPVLNSGSQQKYVAFSPTWYTFSAFQVIQAINLANKIIIIVILSLVFSLTTSLSSFSCALEDLFRPLNILRLPSKVMALSVAITLRFIPSLVSEAFRIIKAQASRGIDYKNGRFLDKVSALTALFIPLFVISFIKADELAAAMMTRGYAPRDRRTSFRETRIYLWELLVMGASLFFLGFLYYSFFSGYYISTLGSLESLLIAAK